MASGGSLTCMYCWLLSQHCRVSIADSRHARGNSCDLFHPEGRIATACEQSALFLHRSGLFKHVVTRRNQRHHYAERAHSFCSRRAHRRRQDAPLGVCLTVMEVMLRLPDFVCT